MQTSMRLLQLNNLQLRDYLGELMTSNAVVELEFPAIDYRPSPFERRGNAAPQEGPAVSKEQLMEDKAAGASALHDLFLQSAALKLSRPLQRIMNYLINALDENGLLHESAACIAQVLGAPEASVRQCISLLQGMEPAGVGASDLKECLQLQLIRQPPADPTALRIVADWLPEMAKGQYGAIARALGVPRAQVMHSCERIRSLNPKPLNGQGSEPVTPYIIPDFYIIEDGGALRCIMNDYYLPKIRIDPSYHDLIRSKQLSAADSAYIQNNYKQAGEVIRFSNTANPPCSAWWNMSCTRRRTFSASARGTARPCAAAIWRRRSRFTSPRSAARSAASSLNASGRVPAQKPVCA